MRPAPFVSRFVVVGSKSPPSRASTHTAPVPSSIANCAATFCSSRTFDLFVSPSFHSAVHLMR
jgi:hypothetical protein